MILTMDMKNDLFVLDDATLDALGRPKQVQLLINTQQRKLVLRACSAEDDEPIFLPDGSDHFNRDQRQKAAAEHPHEYGLGRYGEQDLPRHISPEPQSGLL